MQRNRMRIGLHVRVGEGLPRAAEEARLLGAECIQIFATNPTAWTVSRLREDEVAEFRTHLDQHDIRLSAIHTPYLLNLASPNRTFYTKTEVQLRENIARAAVFGADFVVTHIGSHRGEGFAAGLARITAMLDRVLAEAPPGPMLLLEGSSGAGDLIGNTFEELRAILDSVPDHADRIGICLDSAHMYAAGFDLGTKVGARRVFKQFDEIVGLDRLRLIHANDTRQELGSRRDRHWDIGEGHIGERGFLGMMSVPQLARLDWIMEPPGEEFDRDLRNLKALKAIRARAGLG
jgi:deoxyribonuclease-4